MRISDDARSSELCQTVWCQTCCTVLPQPDFDESVRPKESKKCMYLTLATLIASIMIGTEVSGVQLFADVKVGSESHSGA